LTSIAFDAVKEVEGGFPNYNALFEFLLTNYFFKLPDIRRLTDPELWVSEDGKAGESPFDASFDTRDLLSGKLLAYLDFLVANSPYYNTVNAEVEDALRGCAREHDRHENLREMEVLMKRLYGANAKTIELDETDAPPPKRRRALLSDLDKSDRRATI
jgi:hypothetical protein